MEQELKQRIFKLDEYDNKSEMEEDIKKYISKLKNDYPLAIVTREFYKGNNILVRATKVYGPNIKTSIEIEKGELQQEEVRIKEKGINGLTENVERIQNGKARQIEHNIGGNERERGIKLSAGQKQRLNLIRGILIDKELYFFDEPTSNLDVVSEEKIINMIERYLKNKTYVIVTHRLRLKELCDKHYVFEEHMMKEKIKIEI